MWRHQAPTENQGNEQPIIPPGRRLPDGNVRELLLEILRYLRRLETKVHVVGEAVGANMAAPQKPRGEQP